MPHTIDHQGLYEFVPEADDFVLVKPGVRAAVAAGQGVGLQYTLAAGKGPVRVRESVFLDGSCLDATEVEHEPSESQLFVWDFETAADITPGTYRFEVAFLRGGPSLVAEIVVQHGAPIVEVDAPVRRLHTGSFAVATDGGLKPLMAGLAVRRDAAAVSVGALVDVVGGWPSGHRMTVIMTVASADGEDVVPCLLTGPRALTWPIDPDADPGIVVVTLAFPRNPSATNEVLRFVVA